MRRHSSGQRDLSKYPFEKGRSVVKNASLDVIKREVEKLDPNLDQSDFGFRAAVVLMSAAFVTGPDTESLAAFTGYPLSLVVEISGRMIQAGLWRDGVVNSDHWISG